MAQLKQRLEETEKKNIKGKTEQDRLRKYKVKFWRVPVTNAIV
jgi:hypothetical protein